MAPPLPSVCLISEIARSREMRSVIDRGQPTSTIQAFCMPAAIRRGSFRQTRSALVQPQLGSMTGMSRSKSSYADAGPKAAISQGNNASEAARLSGSGSVSPTARATSGNRTSQMRVTGRIRLSPQPSQYATPAVCRHRCVLPQRPQSEIRIYPFSVSKGMRSSHSALW